MTEAVATAPAPLAISALVALKSAIGVAGEGALQTAVHNVSAVDAALPALQLCLGSQRLDLDEGEVVEGPDEEGGIEEQADGMGEPLADPLEKSLLLADDAALLLVALFAGIAGKEAGLA